MKESYDSRATLCCCFAFFMVPLVCVLCCSIQQISQCYLAAELCASHPATTVGSNCVPWSTLRPPLPFKPAGPAKDLFLLFVPWRLFVAWFLVGPPLLSSWLSTVFITFLMRFLTWFFFFFIFIFIGCGARQGILDSLLRGR